MFFRLCSKPLRVAVSISRLATVQDIKIKALEVANALVAAAASAAGIVEKSDDAVTAEAAAALGEGDESRPATPKGDQQAVPNLEQLPILQHQHTTALDVSGEERGRIKKILENKYAHLLLPFLCSFL